jgi:hypothetical protein
MAEKAHERTLTHVISCIMVMNTHEMASVLNPMGDRARTAMQQSTDPGVSFHIHIQCCRQVCGDDLQDELAIGGGIGTLAPAQTDGLALSVQQQNTRFSESLNSVGQE